MNPRLYGILAVVLAITFEAIGQMALKRGADGGHPAANPLAALWRLFSDRFVLLGLASFTFEAALWTLALRFLPLSIAYPAGSLCFVAVAVLSFAVLGEKVGRQRWIGVCLILAGTALVGLW